MKHNGRIAAAAVCAGLVAVRLLLPEVGAAAREKAAAVLKTRTGYVDAFCRIGTQLSLRGADASENESQVLSDPSASPAVQYIHVPTETRMRPVAADPILPVPDLLNKPLPAPELTPEPTPEPIPDAVQTFLESQTPFSDYALPDNVDYGYAVLPFDYAAPVSGYSASGFGYRVHPVLNSVRFHYGTDIAAWTGEYVLSFADGAVTYAGWDDSFGWHLKIDHGGGWETLYAHCSQLLVSEGQSVGKGNRVALVGESGLATGPHLHFELKKDGRYRNPEYYFNG